jgi:hypothetical protein
MGVSKFPQLELPRLWRRITWHADLRLEWGSKQSCSPCRELSNDMSHAACTQGNRIDSWLLVVRSQIASLTPSLSFGHNFCFRCPNGQCETILDIYTSIVFQWYKKLFKAMGFWPLLSHFANSGIHLGLQLPTYLCATLTLGSRLRQGLMKLQAKSEVLESHVIFPRV